MRYDYGSDILNMWFESKNRKKNVLYMVGFGAKFNNRAKESHG
jgi:hypothetical protein